ncbi:MAG: hypothetical protein JO179_10255 [Solirubrobacterales bacterium]|nr:hypothetical protein [Solirubrobacterales bacterium]
MIDDYLQELEATLRLPRRRRRRILAEVRDHLQSTAAELRGAGLDPQAAQREAIRRFGDAPALARTFAEDEATSAVRAAGWTAVLLAALLVLAQANPPGLLTWTQGRFPAGLLAFVFGQVALLAAGLTLVRVWRARLERETAQTAPPAGGLGGTRLTLVLRGAQVVFVCVAGTLICAVGVALSAASSPTPGVWISIALLGAGAVAGTIPLWRASHRASAAARVGAPLGASPEEDALADIAALGSAAFVRLERRWPRLGGGRERISVWLGELRNRAPRLMAWVDLRRHPWRFALAVALASGLALAVAHAVGEGGPPSLHELPTALVASLLIVAIEGAAVLLGFLVLGGFLGIRGSRER